MTSKYDDTIDELYTLYLERQTDLQEELHSKQKEEAIKIILEICSIFDPANDPSLKNLYSKCIIANQSLMPKKQAAQMDCSDFHFAALKDLTRDCNEMRDIYYSKNKIIICSDDDNISPLFGQLSISNKESATFYLEQVI